MSAAEVVKRISGVFWGRRFLKEKALNVLTLHLQVKRMKTLSCPVVVLNLPVKPAAELVD